jgi:hypothetical protein
MGTDILMEATIHRLDVLHELSFVQPAFVLARNASEIVQIFHETIAPRYPIPPEHMAVNAASILSDLFIRIGLFGNLAALELRVDKMTLRFPQSHGPESIKIVKDTVLLAYDALRKAVPDVRFARALFSLGAWLVLDGGTEAAQKLLREHAMPSSLIDPIQLGGQTASYTLRANVPNPSEKWDVQIAAEPSAIPQANLFVQINLTFQDGTSYHGIDAQISLTEHLVPKIFASLGIDLNQSESAK